MTGVLEQGDLHVLYRPAVEEDDPSGLVDVADLHLVLVPRDDRPARLVTIGRKRLPTTDEGDRFWGYVSAVPEQRDQLAEILGPDTYETQTRGRRRRPACRPAAIGVYDLRRRGRDTRLAVMFDGADQELTDGDVQDALNVPPAVTYVVSVKNPDAGSPDGAGLEDARQADLPGELRDRFEGRRWIAVDPPDFLDHEGVELLFIGAEDEAEGLWDDDADAADPYAQLRLDREQHPPQPLLDGSWA